MAPPDQVSAPAWNHPHPGYSTPSHPFPDGHLDRMMAWSPRYTTLLRAIELWGAVQADGPGRLAGDEEPPAVDGFVVGREEDFSQQIKADPEDRLSAAFVGLDDDRPVFRLPFAGCVGECK